MPELIMTTPESALAIYQLAQTTGVPLAYERAAHALASALECQAARYRTRQLWRATIRATPCEAEPAKRRKTPPPDGLDLDEPLSVPRSAVAVGYFVCSWADGSETTVSAVIYHAKKPAARWAAAYQAANRLRRSRGRHDYADGLEGLTGRWMTGPCGIRVQTLAFERLNKVRAMPPLVSIRDESSGEIFTAPDGSAFGAGQAQEAAALEASLCGARP